MPRRKTKQGKGMNCTFKWSIHSQEALLLGWIRWHLNSDLKQWINEEIVTQVRGVANAKTPNSRLPYQCVSGGHWPRGTEWREVREGKGRTWPLWGVTWEPFRILSRGRKWFDSIFKRISGAAVLRTEWRRAASETCRGDCCNLERGDGGAPQAVAVVMERLHVFWGSCWQDFQIVWDLPN